MQSSLECLESPKTVFKRQERLESRSEQEHGWMPTALLLSHHIEVVQTDVQVHGGTIYSNSE